MMLRGEVRTGAGAGADRRGSHHYTEVSTLQGEVMVRVRVSITRARVTALHRSVYLAGRSHGSC